MAELSLTGLTAVSVILLAGFFLPSPHSQVYCSEGRQFVITLHKQPLSRILLTKPSESAEEEPVLRLLIISATDSAANVTASVPALTHVTPVVTQMTDDERVSTLALPSAWATFLDDAAILVSSSHAVFLYQVTGSAACVSSLLPILPVTSLGTTHSLSCIKPYLTHLYPATLSIIAPMSNTSVNISKPLSAPLHFFTGHFQHLMSQASDVMQTTLSAFRTAMYESNIDLNGYRIVSSAPVAVFISTWVPQGALQEAAHEHGGLQLQQLSVDQWGSDFIDAVDAREVYTAIYRVTALVLGVSIRYKTSIRSGTVHMEHSTQFDIPFSPSDVFMLIKADVNISVLRITKMACGLERVLGCCDWPHTVMIPPTTRWRSVYYLPADQNAARLYTVVIEEESLSGLLIDSSSIEEYFNHSISSRNHVMSGCRYAVLSLLLNDTMAVVSHVDNMTFYMTNHQWSQWAMTSAATQCHVPVTPRANLHSPPPTPTPPAPTHTAGKVNNNPPYPIVYNVQKLGAYSRPIGINLEKSHSSVDEEVSGSNGSPVVGVVATLSVAVFCVLACIVGFIMAELWSRRRTLGRVRVSPFIESE